MKRRWWFLLFLVVAAALGLVLRQHVVDARGMQGTPDEGGEQPMVKFSHAFHISEAGLECVACHPAAQKSGASWDNLHPGHDQCVQCHESQITNTCGFCHVSPDSIEPRVVPPRELRFSHASHIAMKDVECKTCHTDIDRQIEATAGHLPSMETCTTCHNNTRASSQCEQCHTDLAQLLPKDHLRPDFRRFHSVSARLGGLQADCSTCHTEVFCQECHGPVPLKGFGRKDLSGDPRPRTSPKDQPAQTMPQRVHELNYRLTHSVDARSRQSACASCHDYREFCVECHQAGGNINQARFRPPSHNVPGFTTLGRGSGGGEHARMAQRDMESCVSCHDVPGQDPVCMTCHDANGKVH